MIKVIRKSEAGSGVTIGFGLTDEDIEHLKADDVVYADLSDIGLTGNLVVFYGESEADLEAFIAPYITDKTEIRDGRKREKEPPGS